MPAFDRNSDQKIPVSGPGEAGVRDSVRSLTHDLRTPLASLQSCVNLLLNGDAGDISPDQRHFLGLARRNIDRLDHMVEDMLRTARSRVGEAPLRRRQVDLGPVLKETIRLHGLLAAERRLTVDDEGIPGEFPAEVDPDIVLRILDNVLGNALKFTPPGGMVRVWLEAGAGSPRSLAARLARHFGLHLATFNLIVEDNGPGLSSAVQSRIFEPYNPGPREGEEPVSGLGLSITRQLAKAHGGEVRLASLPGRGTTVWLKLPRDSASDHLQNAVDQLQKVIFDGTEPTVQPLVGVVDLRDDLSTDPAADPDLEEFFGRNDSDAPRGWRLAPGFWAAAVLDPVNWNRRWTLHAARKGGGLEATRWEFLTPGPGEELTATVPAGERSETMVNPAAGGPMIF